MKKVKSIIQWVLVLAYFPVVLAFVAKGRSEVVCSDLEIVIKDSVNAQFVTSDQVKTFLLNKYPKLLGSPISDINCEEIEVFFNKHEAINKCEAYSTIGGYLNIHIEQRKPLLRVFSGYQSFYIDEAGNKMPLFEQFAAHVLILSGHVNKLDSLNQIIEFARFITDDPFWNSQIEQIYVENNGEFSLAPRVGDQIIMLGSLQNYSEKMRNLHALYTNGLHPREWNNYKEINLKYEGQIICTKK